MTKEKLPRILSILFFVLYLGGGLMVFRDYGANIDEHCQRYTGGVMAKYLIETFYPSYLTAHPELNSITPLEDYYDKHYGTAFELPVAVAEKVLHIEEDSAGMYHMRHLANFLFFYVGVFFFWLMVRRRFGSELWAVLGAAMLALAPRFFADSFYNSKDIVFLAAFVAAMAAMQLFFDRRKLLPAIWLGLTAAFATDVRIIGVLLPAVAAGVVVWELITKGKERNPIGKELAMLAAMLGSYALFTVLIWPFLWENPLGNFMDTLTGMGQYRWRGSELFMGLDQDVTQLPWYYVPVWVGITMPLLHVGAFLVGAMLILLHAVQSRLRLFRDAGQRFDLACLLLFIAPPLAAIVLGSVLYNGWRQMYFIGGPMVMVSLVGLHWVAGRLQGGWKRWIVPVLAVVQLVASIGYIMLSHPHQYVYFNLLAGSRPAERFEMDYWGLSYREALEYVASADPGDSITVRSWYYTGYMDRSFLAAKDKARLHVHFTDSLMQGRLPDYQIAAKPDIVGQQPGYELIYEVKAGRQTVNWVYKRTAPQVISPTLPQPDSLSTDSVLTMP